MAYAVPQCCRQFDRDTELAGKKTADLQFDGVGPLANSQAFQVIHQTHEYLGSHPPPMQRRDRG